VEKVDLTVEPRRTITLRAVFPRLPLDEGSTRLNGETPRPEGDMELGLRFPDNFHFHGRPLAQSLSQGVYLATFVHVDKDPRLTQQQFVRPRFYPSAPNSSSSSSTTCCTGSSFFSTTLTTVVVTSTGATDL